LIQLFLGADGSEAVYGIAVELLALAAVFQLFDGMQATAAGALRGLKDTLFPMVIGIISYWAIGLTVGYMLSLKHEAAGLWIGLCAGLAVAAILLGARWWRMSTKLTASGMAVAD
jgi:MATE family multidrug resistance protein